MKGIVGTGGHIDHGKTALIGALTGENTDRLPEEQARGISIDLGFSHLDLEAGRLGIVDVPGHEDFIRNMLAGATGIDMLLLVVAADEGVMPQTREHAAIAELLGVHRAVVALTKVDLIDDDWLGLVHDDLADFLAATPFAGAPVVPTSAVTGAGIDELRSTIGAVFTGTRGRPDDLFRLPVDRAFTVHGTGTVVTGTVWSGRLERDASVRLLPGPLDARVRGLQVHGRDADIVEAGERAAIALTGVAREAVERGMTVVREPGWESASILTVRLRTLAGSGWSIGADQRVRAHLGTAEVMARVTLLEATTLADGAEGWAQLRLESPVVARAGDRLVLRSYSPVTTIAGGVVAEPMADRRRRLDAAAAAWLDTLAGQPGRPAVAALLRRAASRGVPVERLAVLSGASPADVREELADAVVAGDRAFAATALEELRARFVEVVRERHERHPLQVGVDPEVVRRAAGGADPALVERALAGVLADGTLETRAGQLALPGWSPVLSAEHRDALERAAQALKAAGPAPPRLDELADSLDQPAALPELIALLEREGRVVRLEHDLFIDAAALRRVVADVRARFGGQEGLGPADFRDAVDVSRRHLMPLLGYLDREGITVRKGEGRTVPA